VTFFDALSDLADTTGGASVNIGRNLMAPLVQQGLSEGLSGNRMLSAFQEAGLGIRRSSFQDLVSNVRDAMAAAPGIAGSPLDQLPATDNIVEWRGGKENTYLYRLNVFTRERDDMGVFQITNVAWDIQTSSLITPGEAVDNMVSQWNQNSPDYPSELMGATVRGVYRQTGNAGR
jgi:hypothetical protein